MNELALIQQDPTGGRLEAWAKAADAAHRLANALCTTTFVPESMREIGNATAAIIMGDELGFTPLASLNSIYVIKGKPALYGRSMLALVLSRGHEVWTVSTSDSKVEVSGRRKDSTQIENSTWTTARATLAGYTSNSKYRSNPQEMLYWKCVSEISRKIGADVLLGIPYSVEEMELEESTSIEMKLEPTKLKISRKKERVEIEAPSLDDESEVETVVEIEEAHEEAPALEATDLTQWPAVSWEPKDSLITEAQVKLVAILMRKIGLVEREMALAFASDVVNRPLESSKELTKLEASQVIEALQKEETKNSEAGDK